MGSGGDFIVFFDESLRRIWGLRLRGLARLLSGSEDSGDSEMGAWVVMRPLRFFVVVVK
jgi:hypothetical protein